MGNNPANREKLSSENQLLVGFENVQPTHSETPDPLLRQLHTAGALPPPRLLVHRLDLRVPPLPLSF